MHAYIDGMTALFFGGLLAALLAAPADLVKAVLILVVVATVVSILLPLLLMEFDIYFDERRYVGRAVRWVIGVTCGFVAVGLIAFANGYAPFIDGLARFLG